MYILSILLSVIILDFFTQVSAIFSYVLGDPLGIVRIRYMYVIECTRR